MSSFELFQEAEAGKVKLGGCCIIEGSPEYYCKDCNNEWNREQLLDIAYGQIRGLKASVGGYFGGYYHVSIDLKNLKTTWMFKEGASEESSTRSIRTKTAEDFINCLKEIDLLNWKARYIEPGVCDGTQWRVKIITDGRTFSKFGVNKFPEKWKQFCKVIKRITGKEFR